MRDYSSEIGSLFKQYDGTLVLVVDVKETKTKDGMNFISIVFEYSNGEQYAQGSEGFYKSFDKVS
jgi:hypothetical protein